MSETKVESQVKKISSPVGMVYKGLSNLNNLNRIKYLIPNDKISDLTIEEETIRFKVDGLGQKVCVRIVEKVENDYIKFGIDNLPLEAYFWMQLKEASAEETYIKLTLKASIPIFFKKMLDGKLQQGIDQAAEMISCLPFQQWNEQ